MRAVASFSRSTFRRAGPVIRPLSTAAFTPMAGRFSATKGFGLMTGVAFGLTATFATVSAASAPPPAKIPAEGLPGTNYERTFIAIKPDGVQRQLIGRIIQRFEDKGFTLVAMKLITPTEQKAAGHYDDLKAKPFFPGLVKFFSSGPVVAMVWQGKGVIKTGRKMLGETKPEDSNPGTIRGDYAVEIGRNICHGSDSPEGAKHEIGFWFGDAEIFPWSPVRMQWVSENP